MVLHASVNGQGAVWGTSWPQEEFTKHEWAGAWICSIFRNETLVRASSMIRDAVAATRYHYGEPPEKGMVTFVDATAVRDKSHPGHAFIIAGFRPVGKTKRRAYIALQLLPGKMPAARPALGMQASLEFAALEGRRFIGIEKTDAYIPIARARIAHAEREFAAATAQGDLFGDAA